MIADEQGTRLLAGHDLVPPGRYFHAVAVDYDGALATSGRPSADVLDAIAQTRADGRRVVLVTGRILAELRSAFPEVDEHFDAIVAENGAVVAASGRDRLLAAPALAALAAVRELGLECQLISNRSALMVLPSGVSKGSGLAAALADLGISPHNTAAVGDAENDHSLLAAAELGIAVGNAVASLKTDADIVLDRPDGEAVASFLRGPVLAGGSGCIRDAGRSGWAAPVRASRSQSPPPS